MSRTVTDKLVAAEISQQVNFGHEEGAVYWIARILDYQP